ncbi:MAG TPA: hypothetical protein VEW07_12495 [Solirubrobacterales bacterium]|nr:hypothetical protein [Solirubrobacterales bacterium]
MSESQPPDPHSDELRTEPIPVDDPGAAPPTTAQKSGESSNDLASRTWKVATALFVPIAFFTVVAEESHEPIAVTFKTTQPAPDTRIKLNDASLNAPILATAESFGFSHIAPVDAPAIDGRGKELVIRLRVSRDSCRELETQIGGDCSGPAKPVLHAPERFTIRAATGMIEAQATMGPATVLEVGQPTESTQTGPPPQWSLSGDANRTEVTITCPWDTPLAFTFLPAHTHPECSPDGVFYRALIVNREPYLATLSFDLVRSFEVHARARRVTMIAADGRLPLGGPEDEIQGVEPAAIVLEAAAPDQVELSLTSPSNAGPAATSLESPRAAAILVDDHSRVPSWLDRRDKLESFAYAAFLTLLLTAVLGLLVDLWSRWPWR